MGQDLTGFDKALKDVYGPRIEEQLSLKNVLSDLVEDNDSQDWTGRQVIYPIHVGRNEGVGASGEGDPLPAAGRQYLAEVKIPVKYNYGRIELTKQVMESSLTNKGAFARAMDFELKGLVRDLGNDLERQRFGSGKGVLALVNGQQNFNATTWLAVDSPFGVTPTTNGGRFLNPNMTIAVIHPTVDATIEGTFTLTTMQGGAISATGATVVLSGTTNVTVSDNARIVRWKTAVPAGGSTGNSLNKESMGLLGILDDGTFVTTLHNVSRTDYPVFKSTVIASVGILSLDVIQRGIDASDELGGGDISANGIMICHHSVRREYLKLLQADRRYTGADLKSPDGGTKKAALKKGGEITYGDIPWRIAKHCPYGTLFGFEKNSAITRYIQIRGEWADEDGAILRNVAGYDKWEAFYRLWDNLHSDRPNEGFRLDGITATVSINHIY
jgi:hypothetical protein